MNRVLDAELYALAASLATKKPDRAAEITCSELRLLVDEVQEYRARQRQRTLSLSSVSRDLESRKRAATALGELARAIIDDRATYEIACEPERDFVHVQSWHTLDKPPTPILRTFGRIWRVKAHERR